MALEDTIQQHIDAFNKAQQGFNNQRLNDQKMH